MSLRALRLRRCAGGEPGAPGLGAHGRRRVPSARCRCPGVGGGARVGTGARPIVGDFAAGPAGSRGGEAAAPPVCSNSCSCSGSTRETSRGLESRIPLTRGGHLSPAR